MTLCDDKSIYINKVKINMASQGWRNSLRVGRIHHAENELNDSAVKLQTSAEQVFIQKAHVSTSFGSHQFLTGQSHT